MGKFLRDTFRNNIHRGCQLLAILSFHRTLHKEPEPPAGEGPAEKQAGAEGEEEEEEDNGDKQHGEPAGVHSAT